VKPISVITGYTRDELRGRRRLTLNGNRYLGAVLGEAAVAADRTQTREGAASR
jgi:hypothetical protein